MVGFCINQKLAKSKQKRDVKNELHVALFVGQFKVSSFFPRRVMAVFRRLSLFRAEV